MKQKLLNLFTLTVILFLKTNGTAQHQANKPDSVYACKKGDQFLQSYQFQKAITHLQQCYQLDTLNKETLKKIALCNLKLGQIKNAKENYFKVLQIDSFNITALNQLGSIFFKETNYLQSLTHYQNLISIDSLNSYYYKQVGNIFIKMNNMPIALMYYEKTNQLNTNDIEAITELSKIYQELKFFEKADSIINKGLQIDSTNMKLMLHQAKIDYDKKEYTKTIEHINKATSFTGDTSIYQLKLLGICSFHIKDYNKSVKLIQSLINQKQESEILHYYLGLAYRELKQYNKSIYHFKQAIDQGISNNISNYYTNLGINFEEQGILEEAIKAYKAAYKSSKNEILLYHLARNYDAYYKDKKTALRYYKKYLASNDTGNIEFKDYSKYRISELKQIIHFDMDSVE